MNVELSVTACVESAKLPSPALRRVAYSRHPERPELNAPKVLVGTFRHALKWVDIRTDFSPSEPQEA